MKSESSREQLYGQVAYAFCFVILGTSLGELNRGTLEYGKARKGINRYPQSDF